jgi:hypothetical protein
MIRTAVIAVLSLFGIATAGVWVASYATLVYVGAAFSESACFFVKVSEGDLVAWWLDRATSIRREGRTVWVRDYVQEVPVLLRTSSELREEGIYKRFECSRWRYVNFWVTSLRFPLACLILVGLSYPTVVAIRGPLRRWRRRRKGLCLKCGYDLTGNTSGVCPECGEAV